MKRPATRQSGFSLLETLLGLTLTAMIGVLMMGSLQMGTRVWERQKMAAQPGEDQLIIAQVAEWLAQARPAIVRSMAEGVVTPFGGNATSVSFLYAAPGMGDAPGLHVVDLALVDYERCTTGKSLVLQTTRLQMMTDDVPPPATPHRRRLIDCLDNPSFVFWGAQASDAAPDWRDQWLNQISLPQLVRLRSFTADGAEHAVFTQRLLDGGLN